MSIVTFILKKHPEIARIPDARQGEKPLRTPVRHHTIKG